MPRTQLGARKFKYMQVDGTVTIRRTPYTIRPGVRRLISARPGHEYLQNGRSTRFRILHALVA